MFLDFGSLHQKPRVGGTHGRVRRDGSDGWRSPVPRGDTAGGSSPSTSSANHRFPVPPTASVHRDGSFFLCIVTGSSVFWDFGSLYLVASRRPSGQLLRQRQTQRKTLRRPGRRLLRQRHQHNDVAASLKPAVAAEAIANARALRRPWPTVAAAVFPRGQDVAASLMCRQFWTTVPVLHCAHVLARWPSRRDDKCC